MRISVEKHLTLDELRAEVRPFATPSDARGWFEVAVTLTLLALFIILAGYTTSHSHTLAMLLGIPSGLLLARTFVLQHDCGHRALFKTPALNQVVGRVLAFLCITPFSYWRHMHFEHHAHTGELDTKRGVGNIWLYTSEEYKKLGLGIRTIYRVYHQPIFLHLIGPTLLFVFLYRMWWIESDTKDRKSMISTNALLVFMFATLTAIFGWKVVLLATLPMVYVASTVGVWWFFTQHSFEQTYFAHSGEFDKRSAIVRGCSHLVLPRSLDWLTGWIGHHALHHLNPSIPCYRLKKCWETAGKYFGETSRFTIRDTLRCVGFALWDDDKKQMIKFSDLSRTA